ncbi:MAG: hypothetical protein IJN48_00375 [Clostridia bacterium]|nr:hypothetical protein [Clostridia bacterium]
MIKISFEKKPKKNSFVRFSKKCITAMIILWFVAVFTCVSVVITQLVRGDMTVNTSDLVTCVGMPLTGGVLGYMIKSAIEDNTKKKEYTYGDIEKETQQP